MSPALLESASALVPGPGATPAGFLPGDTATLVVRASWEGGGTLTFPGREDLEKALEGKVRVLDDGGPAPDSAAQLQSSAGTAQDARAWQVQLLLPPGESELPEIPVTLTPEGGAGDAVQAGIAGPAVTIATVLDSDAAQRIEDVRESPEELKAEVAQNLAAARGPWELASRIPWWLILLAALMLATLLAWAFARWLKRRKHRVIPPPPLESAEVVARRRLRELREGALLTTGRHLEFHVALADILKEYLERRLGADLREQTTDEIRRMMRGSLRATRHVAEIRQDVLAVLDASDLVKFAKAQPLPSEALGLADAVDRLITRTTEAAPAAPPAAGGKEAA